LYERIQREFTLACIGEREISAREIQRVICMEGTFMFVERQLYMQIR
jgi:hypothetical protein